MRKWIVAWTAAALLAFAGAAFAQEMDPLLKLLVDNKVITPEQAVQVQQQYNQQKAGQQQPTPQPPAAAAGITKDEARTVALEEIAKAKPALPDGIKDLKFGGLWYLSFQNGDKYAGKAGETTPYNQFVVKRGYLRVTKGITPWMEGVFTPDVTLDSTGDLKVRMKYIYAKFKWKGNDFIHKPYMEVGMAHMPWLDFEEDINLYRMQDTMFMERNGLFNSADVGILVGSDFGPELPKTYREEVGEKYAGRWGSWQLGVYNGGGYHAAEKNTNKPIEARVTLRPLPDYLPGLQVSGFYVNGKGNVAQPEPDKPYPDWIVKAGMLSYQHKYFVLTGQYYTGEGNQKGDAVYSDGPHKGEARKMDGYSFFAEVRFPENRKFSVIGRYDNFDPDRINPESDLQKRYIFGVAYKLFKGNVLLLDYQTLNHRDPDIPDETRLQLTLQVKF
jgi:hypothetical protein